MAAHVHMAVGLEGDTLVLQKRTLPVPSWSCATLDIDNTVTGKMLCTRSVAQRTTHHAGVTGPACQCGNEAVGHHAATGYLANDAEDGITECLRLLGAHCMGIVFHVLLIFLLCVEMIVEGETDVVVAEVAP